MKQVLCTRFRCIWSINFVLKRARFRFDSDSSDVLIYTGFYDGFSCVCFGVPWRVWKLGMLACIIHFSLVCKRQWHIWTPDLSTWPFHVLVITPVFWGGWVGRVVHGTDDRWLDFPTRNQTTTLQESTALTSITWQPYRNSPAGQIVEMIEMVVLPMALPTVQSCNLSGATELSWRVALSPGHFGGHLWEPDPCWLPSQRRPVGRISIFSENPGSTLGFGELLENGREDFEENVVFVSWLLWCQRSGETKWGQRHARFILCPLRFGKNDSPIHCYPPWTDRSCTQLVMNPLLNRQICLATTRHWLLYSHY